MSRRGDLDDISPEREPIHGHEQDKWPYPGDQQQQVEGQRHEVEENKARTRLQTKQHPSAKADPLGTLRSSRIMTPFDGGGDLIRECRKHRQRNGGEQEPGRK